MSTTNQEGLRQSRNKVPSPLEILFRKYTQRGYLDEAEV